MYQPSGTVNRLTRPIAVIGSREAYMHLCEHCYLNPNNNDVFFHVQFVWDVEGKEFSRVLTIKGAQTVRERLRVVSAARGKVRND